MRVRSNGGIIGPRNAATASTASGIWSMPEQEAFVSGSLWPLWLQYYYNSVQFNGSSQYLSIPSNTAFDENGIFTIECWVYRTSNAAGGYVFAELVSGYLALDFTSSLNFIADMAYIGTKITSTNTYAINTWYHVAITYDGTTTRLFVNGTLQGTYVGGGVTSGATFTIGNYLSGTSYFPGYISNLRIIKGTALYTTTFTPPTIPLSAISGTSLLTCNSPTIVDNSTNALTITNNGTATVSSTNPFGSYATVFTSSSQYIDIPNNAALSQVPPWTIEMWIYPTAVNVNCYIFGQVTTSWAYLNMNTGGYLNVDRSGVSTPITSSSPLTANTWYHIALVADGTNLKLYINGVQSGSTVAWTLSVASAAITRIGAYQNSGGSGTLPFPGYIYNLRYIKGTALYTSNFTPPSSTLTAITNTSLLTCQYQELFDASTNNLTLSPTGTPTFSKTALPF